MPTVVRIFAPAKSKGQKEPQLPSSLTMAGNAAKALIRTAGQVIAGKRVLAPEWVQSERWETCKSCDMFRQSDLRCSLCGCYTRSWLVGKIELAKERCPLNKWVAYEIETTNHEDAI